MFLAECCPSRKVHMVIRRTLGVGISEYLASRIKATRNVVVHDQTEVDSVYGDRRIEAIELRNNTTDQRQRIPCAAVFVFIGAEPSAHWLPAQIARDDNGYVLAGTDAIRSGLWPKSDRDPCPLETTLPGVLVGGDIRSGSTKRVGFAVGDGSLAVTCVHRLLSMRHRGLRINSSRPSLLDQRRAVVSVAGCPRSVLPTGPACGVLQQKSRELWISVCRLRLILAPGQAARPRPCIRRVPRDKGIGCRSLAWPRTGWTTSA